MTAFDNIKTNNWPSGSNDFEDFLVLELPLNDDAALTSSRRDIVAGSKVLHPKRTLTNSSVFANSDVGSKWDASTTGSPYNGSWDVVFDGNATANTSTQGAAYWFYTYESTTSITLRESISGQIEILAGRPGSNDDGTHSITLQSGGSDVHSVTLGTNGASGYQWFDFGTRSNIDKFVIEGGDPGVAIWAVRLDGVLLVNPTGGPKKHYDNNAVFTAGGSGNVITYDADTRNALKFGTGDFTVEAWVKKEQTDATSGSSACILEIGDHFSNTGVIFMASDSSTKAYSSTGYGSGGALTLGQWHHVAWSRSNGTLKVFLDGQQTSSVAFANDLTDIQYATTGKSTRSTSVSYHFNGAIQDLRVYKGVGKYTSNFTPPGAILG